MPTIGSGSLFAGLSYIAVGRETAFGTASPETTTSMKLLNPMSFGLKTVKDSTILEEISGNRVHARRVQLGKVISGDVEYNFYPNDDASNYLLHLAFGGAVTTATDTSETVGGGGFDHTIEIGDMENSFTSLTFNVRRGPSTTGKVSQYIGTRVNEMTFSAEIDAPLKVSASLIAKDSTVGANDIESILTATALQILNFTGGRLSVESAFASLTSTAFWHIQTMEFSITNSLKSESESRRIGSDTLDVLPAGIATLALKATIRFDTTTAFDHMIAADTLSAQFEFLGNTITGGSSARYGLKMNFPKVFIKEASEPEISGPDEILTVEVAFDVLLDKTSAAGYAVQAIVTNTTTSYA